MAEFKWDDDSVDPMDGFDTDPTPTVVAPPPPRPSPILAKKVPPKPTQAAVAQEVDDLLEDSPDPAELTEAEWRLEKAGYYRAVINSQLLSSDHPAAVEVEVELQQWAKEQLETLLGLRVKATGEASVQRVVQESQFTEEEAAILRQLVSKVQSRSAGTPAPAPQPEPQPVAVKTPTPAPVQPATAKPKAQIAPVTTQDSTRRGRGRPRKNPCRICGKMECEHKRTASPQPQTQGTQPKTSAPISGEMYDGLPIQLMPDGTKFVESPDGRRYKLDLRQVTHKQTGEVRTAYIPVELSKTEKNPLAKPYPSEQEVMAMAAVEAAKNAGAMQSLTAATAATGTPRKFTGTDLINAAMAAPERESYIPEPPQRK